MLCNVLRVYVFIALCSVDSGGWGDWSAWSYCSATCGRGKMERSRQCDSPEPVGGGKPCVGLLTQQKDCSIRECPGLYDFASIVSTIYIYKMSDLVVADIQTCKWLVKLSNFINPSLNLGLNLLCR